MSEDLESCDVCKEDVCNTPFYLKWTTQKCPKTITFCGWYCLTKYAKTKLAKDVNEQTLTKDVSVQCDQCGILGTIYNLQVCPQESDLCSWQCFHECVENGCPWTFDEDEEKHNV